MISLWDHHVFLSKHEWGISSTNEQTWGWLIYSTEYCSLCLTGTNGPTKRTCMLLFKNHKMGINNFEPHPKDQNGKYSWRFIIPNYITWLGVDTYPFGYGTELLITILGWFNTKKIQSCGSKMVCLKKIAPPAGFYWQRATSVFSSLVY